MTDQLLAQFVEFAFESGIPIQVGERIRARLPAYIGARYEVRSAGVGGSSKTLILVRDQPEAPLRMVKQLNELIRVLEIKPTDFCLVLHTLDAYARQQLLERRMPFCVPGKILYWPAMGTVYSNLRPRRTAFSAPAEIRPATQQALIALLLKKIETPCPVGRLADVLGFAPITASRAGSDLTALGWLRATNTGRQRLIELAAPAKEIWKRARPMLASPVAQVVYVRPGDEPRKPMFTVAGLTALASLSDLAAPSQSTLACALADWRRMAGDVSTTNYSDVGLNRIELWTYSQGHLATDGLVDPLSLCLSLQAETDPRIERALEQVEESIKW